MSSTASPPRTRGPARKTYSKRVAEHVQKRKAEALRSSDDEEDFEEDLIIASPLGDSGRRLKNAKRETSSDKSSPHSPKLRRNGSVPRFNLEPASSSPALPQSLQAPSTPPRSTSRPERPSTPQSSSPRDLSSLFAAVSPNKSPAGSKSRNAGAPRSPSSPGNLKPGGMRRMLTKSQSLGEDFGSQSKLTGTSSSRDDPFGASLSTAGPSTPSKSISRTQSLPSSPLSSPGSAASLIVPANQQGGSGGKAKRTYGGNRSFLAQTAQENARVEQIGKDEEPLPASYAELRKKFEVDNSGLGNGGGSGNLLDDLLIAKPPQPVSDMRSKGENRRFLDELGYLTEGIADPRSRASLKRTSSIEILRNMGDETWMGKMKICGQTEVIWDAFNQARDEDEIMDAVCLVFLGMLVKSGSGLETLVRSPSGNLIKFLSAELNRPNGPLDEGHSSKVGKQTLRDFASSIVQDSRLRHKTLASYILVAISSEGLWPMLSSEDQAHFIETILEIFGKEDEATAETTSPMIIYHLLRIVSAMVLISSDVRKQLTENSRVAQKSVDELRQSVARALDVELAVRTDALSIIEGLKILANMSNISPSWAKTAYTAPGGLHTLARILFHRDEISKSTEMHNEIQAIRSAESVSTPNGESFEDQTASSTEILCLVLALFTSGILADSELASEIRTLEIDPSCPGGARCAKQCCCPQSRPFLSELVSLYEAQAADTEDSASTVLIGYIALLLSKLFVHDVSSQQIILDKLAGKNPRSKIESLLASLSELTGLQSLVNRKFSELNGEAEAEEEQKGDRLGPEIFEQDVGIVESAVQELGDIMKLF